MLFEQIVHTCISLLNYRDVYSKSVISSQFVYHVSFDKKIVKVSF